MIPTDLRWPDLIYVNGPSSAGKTTLCRGLQSAIPVACVCIGFDDTAVFGPVFRRLILSMPAAVGALVDGGNQTIFDDVLHDAEMDANRQQAFAGLDVFTVGDSCDVAVLEARERSRGDRVLGRARGLVDVVHSFCGYDVVVDTGMTGPDECVAEILAAMRQR
jgi:chloramphenicol 3-O phosphotransferase